MDQEIGVKLHRNPVAIIGMAAVMPQASNLQEYWDNIVRKIDCIQDVPPSRWNVDDYFDPDPSAPDKTYCKRGGFIPDIDFDPLEYGLPPNILEVTDVSQLLSLVVAKDALADAGYAEASETIRERTGIILGVGGGQKLITPLTSRLQYPIWEKVLKSCGLSNEDTEKAIEKMKLAYVKWEENSFPGMLGNVIAGRIANRLDLGGINCVVDAACASSLAAFKMGVSELTEGRTDMMISGGVDTDNSIFMYMCFSKTPAFSRHEQLRPFDADSDGMMVGEGIGMLVLKRLSDAERDGDRIYAVVKGIGTSSDGRYKSIYAPRSEGQERALRRAYEDAGFPASTVGLIEAHGTGTVAGDQTEVTTLCRTFGEETDKQHSIALGSVKSQVGHTKATAGAAGLMKAALALYHKVLPATINVDAPNPKFGLEDSPFYLNTETRPWLTEDGGPRRAGVSSFGFGGTNFHVVLEEHQSEQQMAYRMHKVAQEVVISAPTPPELVATLRTTLEQLHGDQAEQSLLNLAKTTGTIEVPQDHARLGFVARSARDACELAQLALDGLDNKPDTEEWQHPRGIYYRRSGLDLKGKVVALFSGQGAQYVEMGRELAVNFPTLRETYRQFDQLFAQDGLRTLSETVFPAPTFDSAEKQAQIDALQRTEYAQPAIGAFSASLYKLLKEAGFAPDFAAGHSFGELTALWAAGVLNDKEYFELVKARGKAMAPPNEASFDTGAMLAVTGSVKDIEVALADFPGVSVANYNSPRQVVLAGATAAVAAAEQALQVKGYNAVRLPVSAAFHTILVGHAQQPFAQVIERAVFNKPQMPVYSNASGEAYPDDAEAAMETLAAHMLQPVRFQQEIENLYDAGGFLFIEFGPRNILTNLVKETLGDKPHVALALNASRQKDSDWQLRDAVVQLRVLGLKLGTVDKFRVDPASRKKASGATVKINGGLYVSEKTQAAFERALNDGYRVKGTSSNTPVPSATLTPVQETGLERRAAGLAPAPVTQAVNVGAWEYVERGLTQFAEQQRETLRVHEQYLQNQAEYFRILAQLTQQQQTALTNPTLPPQVVESATRSLALFHEHQAQTLKMHEQYLQRQSEYLQTYLQLLREQSAATTNGTGHNGYHTKPTVTALPTVEVVPAKASETNRASLTTATLSAAPAPVGAVSLPEATVQSVQVASTPVVVGVQVEALAEALLTIVSEKTGYPAEMLELSMDVEADLGIDSIKRVEILGAMREQFPSLPQLKPEELAELRTLGQIVEYMRANVDATTLPAAKQVASNRNAAEAPQTVTSSMPEPAATGADVAVLSRALLEIVSEKTGYPAEMLELSMDIEADLGIDSIKRVEILGAMREQFPSLPQLKPEELAELRTLGQIVEYMKGATGTQIPVGFFRPELPNLSHDIPRSVVALRPLPSPDCLEISLPDGVVCLMTDDGTETTTQLAERLMGRGWKVVVLSFPSSVVPTQAALPAGVNRVGITGIGEAALKTALDHVASQHGSVGVFIHLSPPAKTLSENGTLFVEREKELVKAIFLIAKLLKERLNKSAQAGLGAFVTVARLDGALGLAQASGFGAIAGGLFGLTKSLNLEWEQVYCRAIDLAVDIPAGQAAQHILAELHDPNRMIAEVAYGAQGRVTLAAHEPAKQETVLR